MTCANCMKKSAPRSALCWRCLKYRQRKGRLPVDPPQTYGDQWETLKAAMRAWLNIDSDSAFKNHDRGGRGRAEARLARAAERWVASRPKRPRKGESGTVSNK